MISQYNLQYLDVISWKYADKTMMFTLEPVAINDPI